MKKSRKRLVLGHHRPRGCRWRLWRLQLNKAQADFDPARIATVEKGTMVKSVVATGKIEPITKVEIKSKANGIVEALHVEVGDRIQAGQTLAELDKELLAGPASRRRSEPAGRRGEPQGREGAGREERDRGRGA